MPFAEVKRRRFGLSAQGMTVDDLGHRLADEFSVTAVAMRVRLQHMRLVRG